MIRLLLMPFAAAILLAAPVAAGAEYGPDEFVQPADSSPLLSSFDVVSVSPFYEVKPMDRVKIKKMRGASVRILAEQGMSEEWLQRRLNEHVTRMRTSTAGMQSCPLAVSGVKTSVTSSGDGYVIEIRADNRNRGEEVLERARLLVH